MAMDPTFAKLAGLVVVGSVAKSLFGQPKPPVTNVHNHIAQPEAETPEEKN